MELILRIHLMALTAGLRILMAGVPHLPAKFIRLGQ
jgi:hypothetical protein